MKAPVHTARVVAWLGLLVIFARSGAVEPAHAADPLPEFYGFYAVDSGGLIELKEDANDWPDVAPGVRLIVFSKGIALGAVASLRLSRMRYLRRTVDPSSAPREKVHNAWYITTDTAREVELRAKPIPGQPEMIMLVPREPLVNGAYAVRSGDTTVSRFFVGKGVVLKNLLASDDCVDHIYEDMDGKQFSFSKMDRRIRGGGYVVQICSRTDAAGSAEPAQSSAPKPQNVSDPSVGVNSIDRQLYESCVRSGNTPAYCEYKYPQMAPSMARLLSGPEVSSTAASEAPAASDVELVGLWTGQIRTGIVGSDARFEMQGGAIGQFVGSTEYSGSYLYCRGKLRLTESSPGQYVFEEEIVEKNERATCPGGGQVTMVLSDSQTADVQWARKGLKYKGTLSR